MAPSPATARGAIADFVAALEADAELGRALVHREQLPARSSRCAELPGGYEHLAPVLTRRSIEQLYVHQTRALAALGRGRDVVLATSTASGKTLVYALSTLRAALADPRSRALYLFPLKALSQDQRRGLEGDIGALGRADLRVAVYDGDTPAARRRALREDPPQVLITTPDMLHAGLLPHHGLWREFFAHLGLVVVDELHTYRGVFGAHVAQLMRRLDRVARHHGASPRVVAASATLANAGELAHGLFGRPFEVIEEDGAPRSARDVLLFRPRGSPYTLAAQLFRAALARGLRTIAFTKARVITELLHNWVVEAQPELAPRISSYRAGFLPSERREIERRLFDGALSGVIATSALELGIDVGGLDVCILVGYPAARSPPGSAAGAWVGVATPRSRWSRSPTRSTSTWSATRACSSREDPSTPCSTRTARRSRAPICRARPPSCRYARASRGSRRRRRARRSRRSRSREGSCAAIAIPSGMRRAASRTAR